MRELVLSTGWQVKAVPTVEDPLSAAREDDGWVAAEVPGLAYEALWSAGRLPDPYLARSHTPPEPRLAASFLSDYLYRCRFDAPPWLIADPAAAHLCCDGLDTVATVWLNGARVLRSDVFRKRLAGVSPETRLPPRHYTPRNDAETYEALFESADDHLACGNSVILDAVFMSRSERDVAEMIAMRRRVPFVGIWLEAPERDRIARVLARENDASDAGPDVVHEQSRRPVGDVGWWNRIRANRPIELIVAAARAAIERAR